MKELVIDKLGDNQRLDKYLQNIYLPPSKSFIYKMLRKKNITLNNKKADGSEKLVMGDSVKIFLPMKHLKSLRRESIRQVVRATAHLLPMPAKTALTGMKLMQQVIIMDSI